MTTNGFMDDPNLTILIPIAQALGDLRESLVFVGGCATGLLVTAQRAQSTRATLDVDVIAPAVSIGDYHAVEKALRARGFRNDSSQGAPICRWVWDDVALDVMPSEPGILGFHNRWYPLAEKTATRTRLPGGLEINLVAAPVFVATKLEAFHGRGNNDYLASHDLEDLLTVVDGRPELIQEVEECDRELTGYIAAAMAKLLADDNFLMALPGHLPADAGSQARLPELMNRLRRLATLKDR